MFFLLFMSSVRLWSLDQPLVPGVFHTYSGNRVQNEVKGTIKQCMEKVLTSCLDQKGRNLVHNLYNMFLIWRSVSIII